MGILGQHILAAYFNDARLNLRDCLNDIREKSGYSRLDNDDQIQPAFSDLKLTTSTPERQSELIKQLRYRFPFLDVLVDSSGKGKQSKANAVPLPHYYESQLTWMLALVQGLRNTFTHSSDAPVELDFATHRRVYLALSKIYKSSFHTVKNRFGHATVVMKPLERCGKGGKPKEPAVFSFAAIAQPPIKPQPADKARLLKLSAVFHDFGFILFCALFLEKSQSAALIEHFWQLPQHARWSGIERGIIREMLAVYRLRLPLQRLQAHDTETAVTLDTLSELSRCPRPLLATLKPEDQQLFRGDGGDNNSLNAPDEGEQSAADNTFLFARGHDDRFIPLMMRFLDFDNSNKLRFAVDLGQFYYNVRLKPAEHFTDQKPRVRRLGQKVLAYGRLLDFEQAAKPQNWQDLEANYYQSQTEENTLLASNPQTVQPLRPYIVPTYPHYHYFEDKIGFRLAQDEKKASYPELNVSQVQQAAIVERPVAQTMQPDFWMSPAQLLAVAFYHHLKTRPKVRNDERYLALDVLFNKYRIGMRQLINALPLSVVLAGAPHSPERRAAAQQWVNQFFDAGQNPRFHVAFTSLPSVLIEHLLGKTVRQLSVAEVVERAQHLLNETTHKKKQIDQLLKSSKQSGQKGFKPIKCGHIGDFLAEDLLRFQPVDSSREDGGKINSQRFQILQAALAYYGAHLHEPPRIVDLLVDAGLLGGDYAHPFLADLKLLEQPAQYQGLISFYEAYLKARATFLKRFIGIQKKQQQAQNPQWLRLRAPSQLANWLEEQRDKAGQWKQPLPLVDNLLYVPIRNMTAEMLGMDAAVLEQEGSVTLAQGVTVRPAVTWLIKRYLAYQQDGSQTMYQLARQHNLFNTWLDKRGNNQKFAEKRVHYLLEHERQALMLTVRDAVRTTIPSTQAEQEKHEKLAKLLKAYQRDEQAIRCYIPQDMLLYLYARQYLQQLQLGEQAHHTAPVWQLRTLERTLLNTSIRYELAVPKTDKALFHPACKIRQIGELALWVRDRRLTTLMPFYPLSETHLHHAEVAAELMSYQRTRVKIMGLVQDLERQILKSVRHVPELTPEQKHQLKLGKGRHGDFLFALYQRVQQRAPAQIPVLFAEETLQRVLNIRNAFAHNQYPAYALFTDVVQQVQAAAIPANPANHRKVAECFVAIMETTYRGWQRYLS